MPLPAVIIFAAASLLLLLPQFPDFIRLTVTANPSSAATTYSVAELHFMAIFNTKAKC